MLPHRQLTDEIAESAALYALAILSEPERSALDQHLLEGCAICQSEINRCLSLVTAWSQETQITPPASMRQRLLESIRVTKRPPATSRTPLLLNRTGLTALRTTEMEWKAGPTPGLWFKLLFDDAGADASTALVRMDPGARYPSHRHEGFEEVYVLEGELQLEGIKLIKGDFCLAHPNSVHDDSYSPSGCLMVVKTSKRDEILI